MTASGRSIVDNQTREETKTTNLGEKKKSTSNCLVKVVFLEAANKSTLLNRHRTLECTLGGHCLRHCIVALQAHVVFWWALTWRAHLLSLPLLSSRPLTKPFFPEVLLLRPKTQFQEILSSCTAATKQCLHCTTTTTSSSFVQSPYQLPLRVHVYSTRKVHALRMTNKVLSKERLSLRYQPTELQYKLPEK